MKNKELSLQDIILMRREEFNPEMILRNATENRITICKSDNYKLKKGACEEILRYKNADILSTNPPPQALLGELLVFFPNISPLLFLFSIMKTKVLTKSLLNTISIRYLSPEKFPCSFFIGHMPELSVWQSFTEESFLGYPQRELSLNLYCSGKKFKFHTEQIIE